MIKLKMYMSYKMITKCKTKSHMAAKNTTQLSLLQKLLVFIGDL